MTNYIIPLKEIPSKTEIEKYVDYFVNSEGSPLEKYLTVKLHEEAVKQILPKLKDLAKEDFLKSFGGVTKQDCYGLTVSLKNMTASNALKDPTYEFSEQITYIEKEIQNIEQELKFKKDELKLRKTHEINTGIAKKLDPMFDEEKKPEENFQLTITLRK